MTIRRREHSKFQTLPSKSGTRPPRDYCLWHEGGDLSAETAAIGISAARNSVLCRRRCRDLLYRGGRNIRLLAHFYSLEADHRAGALALG